MNTHMKLHSSGKRTSWGCHGAADDNGRAGVSRIRRKVLCNGGRAGCDGKGLGR